MGANLSCAVTPSWILHRIHWQIWRRVLHLQGRTAEKFDFWHGHDGWTKFFPKEYNSPSCQPYHKADQDIITFIMGEAMMQFLDAAAS